MRKREYYEAFGDDFQRLLGRVPKYCLRRPTQAPIRAVVNSLARMTGCRIEANPVGDLPGDWELYELHAWRLEDCGTYDGTELYKLWVSIKKERQLSLPHTT